MESGQWRVTGNALDLVRPQRRINLLAHGRRTLVVPQDRRANHLVVLIEEHRPVHLTRDSDGIRIRLVDLGKALLHADPPVFRVLLGPHRLRNAQRIFRRRLLKYFARLIDQQHFATRRSDVNSQQLRHGPDFGTSPPARAK